MKNQMRINNKGQLAGWEALIIIMLMGALGWMFYLYAHKPSQSQIFQSDSKPQIREIKASPFSCVREGEMERWTDAATNKNIH